MSRLDGSTNGGFRRLFSTPLFISPFFPCFSIRSERGMESSLINIDPASTSERIYGELHEFIKSHRRGIRKRKKETTSKLARTI